MRGLIAAGEGSASALTLVKLANVGLSMLWGFAVTFVFVRVLAAREFESFLLLVAFNNFTISGEFGLTNVIYARLRRFWLGRGGEADAGDFRLEEIGVLFLFLGALILLGGLIVAVAILLGWIATDLPAVFLIFFAAAALNVLLLLAKRALAAVDRNMIWEVLDVVRRLMGLAALFSVLAGASLLASVAAQLLLNCMAAVAGLWLLHRRLGMRARDWLSWHVGGGHVRRTYLRDIGASVALTISEVTAYNSPYFLIAAFSPDPRFLLLFDFVFKMMRALAAAIRATIEGALPRLTHAWFGRQGDIFSVRMRRILATAAALAAGAGILLIAAGQSLFAFLYDGRSTLATGQLLLLCAALLLLAVICVSVYVQTALGRFAEVLRWSLPFMAGSVLIVPLAVKIHEGAAEEMSVASVFMILYALLFLMAAATHAVSLRRLRRMM